MLWLHLAIVLAAIFLGARMGSIGIGMAGGLGVIALALAQAKVQFSDIPFDVIGIIMCVICAIAAMQRAGGMDLLVHWAERLLRRNPKRITLVAPLVTYFMSLMAGTGHTAFSTLPVIAEVAKDSGVRPSRPLSISVVSSQLAITASPVSAAVVYMAAQFDKAGLDNPDVAGGAAWLAKYGTIDYLDILALTIPTTLLAVIMVSFVANHLGKPLAKDPEYQRRLKAGLIVKKDPAAFTARPRSGVSVAIFTSAIVLVMIYATLISDKVGLIEKPTIDRNCAIMAIMLSAATFIALVCRIDPAEVLNQPTFKAGMSACACVLGVAWLGTTFVQNHMAAITGAAGDVVGSQPWLLAVVLLLASALLYSQAATSKAMMPLAISLGASPVAIMASFAAVSGLFILPTYPTLIAAVEMDATGSTRIGKYVFNHPFMIPGLLTIAVAVGLGFVFGPLIL